MRIKHASITSNLVKTILQTPESWQGTKPCLQKRRQPRCSTPHMKLVHGRGLCSPLGCFHHRFPHRLGSTRQASTCTQWDHLFPPPHYRHPSLPHCRYSQLVRCSFQSTRPCDANKVPPYPYHTHFMSNLPLLEHTYQAGEHGHQNSKQPLKCSSQN